MATVAGLVRDSETQEPLEGVEIVLTTGRGEARVRSDARGEFEARLAPGLLTCEVTDATKGHAAPWRAFRAPIEVTSADGPQTLPPIDLEPGRNVQGVVVDENDQPVAGAKVQAIWRASSRWLETSAAAPRLAATASDAKGEFRLSVVRPSGQPAMFWQGPWLMASIDGAATVRPEAIGPDTKEPVRLRLEPGGSVSIAGRAVDSTGQPLARAAVEIWIQWQNRGVAYFSSPLASAGQDELRTDDERRFRTIRRFSREAEYAVRFRADGFMPGMSRYAHAGGEATLTLGEVSLTRLRVIRGRVVDRQGRPVAGVRVFQSGDGPARTEATTGADGRFAVEGVVEGPAFLFVEKDGFRFHGQLVEPGRQDADLMIRRTNEPPEPLPRPQAMAREEELELARRAYRPLLDEGFADRDVQARFMILRNWSRLNPVAALESLDQGALADGGEGFHEALRGQIANALSLTEPDDAVAVAESIKGNAERAYAMVVLAGKLPASRREVKLDLLEQAVPFVRASDRPGLRAIWLECIADGLLDLGESRRATAVLDEARVLAASLPKAGPGSVERACVAEVVARVDLEGALELSEGLPEFPRYGDVHGKIAFRIAGRLPADAERVLELCRDSFQRDMFIPRVCWRMAPADPRRARMLAEKIRSPHLRPHALGLMAMALAETDAEQARELLSEAFDMLLRISAGGEERVSHFWMTAALEAALLVRAAESADSERAGEYFWRALSLRMPTASDHDTVKLAIALAQYDPASARFIVEPVVERTLKGDVQGSFVTHRAVSAACAIDPRWAVEIVERLPANQAGASGVREEALRALAWVLGALPENRMRSALDDYFNNEVYWPGAVDNYYIRLRN